MKECLYSTVTFLVWPDLNSGLLILYVMRQSKTLHFADCMHSCVLSVYIDLHAMTWVGCFSCVCAVSSYVGLKAWFIHVPPPFSCPAHCAADFSLAGPEEIPWGPSVCDVCVCLFCLPVHMRERGRATEWGKTWQSLFLWVLVCLSECVVFGFFLSVCV